MGFKHFWTCIVDKGGLKVRQSLNDFFQADVSYKKQMNKLDFTTMRLVFVHFLEEIEGTKKKFQN